MELGLKTRPSRRPTHVCATSTHRLPCPACPLPVRVADVPWMWRCLPGVRQMSYIDEISWQLRSYPSYVKGGMN